MANPGAWRLIRRVNDLAEDVAETLAPFIAGPRPADPIRGHYHDYTRWVCNSYANVPNWLRFAPGPVNWMAVDSTIGAACSQYLGDGMPRIVPPFAGGQCATWYSVYVVYEDEFRNFPSDPWQPRAFAWQGDVHGPIRGLGGTGITQAVLGTLPSGAFYSVNTSLANQDTNSACSQQPNNFRNCRIRIASVTRKDGQPDNCGSLRPKTPTKSPTAPPDPGPPPGGGQPPLIGPRGTPIFRPGPIRSPYDEPDTPCPPFDPWYPDDGGEDDPYYGPDSPRPGDPGDPGTPRPTGDGGEAEEEAPEGTELVGLKLELLEVPEYAKEFAPGVYRGACYIYMGNEAGLDQDFAGSMVSDGQFVLAEKSGLTRWRVASNSGYNIRVTPYYREID